MEKKKMLAVYILVAVLIVGVGGSFAFFLVGTKTSGTGVTNTGQTATVGDTTVTMTGSLAFNATGIYPGHQNISKLQVNAKGDKLVLYNITWEGTNNLTKLNYTVYKSTSSYSPSVTCTKKTQQVKQENGNIGIRYYEECGAISPSLGTAIATGTINKGTNEVTNLISSQSIQATSGSGANVYYYVLLEFPNDSKSQNVDLNGTFNGTVKVNLLEEEGKTVKDIIATLNAKAQTASEPNFNSAATSNEGVYYTTDDDGTTYYYRGAVTNNYVKFGKTGLTSSGSDMWWRIIRFNGDGSIRLIYDGTAYHANGTTTSNSIAVAGVKWSHPDALSSSPYTYANDNVYVGYMYGTVGASTYDATHANINSSNAKTQLETWYTNNLADEEAYIDKNAGFCGDRTSTTIEEGTPDGTGGYSTTITYYGTNNRLIKKKTPTYTCPQQEKDLYTINTSNKGNKAISKPIGLITADEVAFAGGIWATNNTSYYLYNGQSYWTISPYYFNGNYAYVWYVHSGGNPTGGSVYIQRGVRPVINLKSGTLLKGQGTQSSPYEIVE